MARLSPPKKAYSAYSAGERLRKICLEKDISVTEIARATNVGRSTIYSFFYDGIDISSVRLMKICGYVGVSMDYVMGLKRA